MIPSKGNIGISTRIQLEHDLIPDLDLAIQAYLVVNPEITSLAVVKITGVLAEFKVERTTNRIIVVDYNGVSPELSISCTANEAASLLGVSLDVISLLVRLGKLDVTPDATRITNESIDRCWREKLAGKLLSH